MGEGSIRGSQLKDPDLKLIIDYLENGILPQDKGIRKYWKLASIGKFIVVTLGWDFVRTM